MLSFFDQRLLKQTISAITVCVGLSGCATYAGIKSASGDPVVSVIDTITKGDARLPCESFGCYMAWSNSRNNIINFANNSSWYDLAIEVAKVGYSCDTDYFFLGAASEGLGYESAAVTYYKLALSTENSCQKAEVVQQRREEIRTRMNYVEGRVLAKDKQKYAEAKAPKQADTAARKDAEQTNKQAEATASRVFVYDIRDDFQQIIIDRWNNDIPATVQEIIKIKNYELGSDISNTMFKMCTPHEYDSSRQCKTDKYGTKFLSDFRYGNIDKGIYTTIGKNNELLAIEGSLPTNEAAELEKILTEKYGKPSLKKSERYYSKDCTNAPYLTGHSFWKDVNGTVIQLDTTNFSYCSTSMSLHIGRITIMSKPYIDTIQDMLIKFNEKLKQEKEREKKKAIDNL